MVRGERMEYMTDMLSVDILVIPTHNECSLPSAIIAYKLNVSMKVRLGDIPSINGMLIHKN
jgi:hypothetical protein